MYWVRVEYAKMKMVTPQHLPIPLLTSHSGLDNKCSVYQLSQEEDLSTKKRAVAMHTSYVSCCTFMNSDQQVIEWGKQKGRGLWIAGRTEGEGLESSCHGYQLCVLLYIIYEFWPTVLCVSFQWSVYVLRGAELFIKFAGTFFLANFQKC